MMRRKSKRRRLVAPAPVTLGPDLSGPKTSGSSSASVQPNTETETLHLDDAELKAERVTTSTDDAGRAR